MKQQLIAKDQELRGKQREMDRLYGKLAVASITCHYGRLTEFYGRFRARMEIKVELFL
ncbi:MAG TPA: hypothetical protein VFV38_33850 [Ktedonobacteraceae bacterium]|nr:hypothetical protein [Ktedonobacteraceae bacterium]